MAGVYKQGTFATSGNVMGVCPIVHPEEIAKRRRAVRAVASMSQDATDCATILAMLGLDPVDGVDRP